jgi:DNA-binding MarR family transcriptional regulator
MVTDAGRAAIARINPQHAVLADRLTAELGVEQLASTVDALTKLAAALDAIAAES